ncbi:MAG: hypothetical protein M0000_07305 [Actinomycetota bacterium]|nr:hypothetical protein [Actinomycetota bacterium]
MEIVPIAALIETPRTTSRLRQQLARVQQLMSDGRWRTLADISQATSDPEASVSARLRDLRKQEFGGHTVTRRKADPRIPGLYEYQLTLRSDTTVSRGL